MTEIIFLGTEKDWLSIEKEYGWDENTGKYTITCSDGTVIQK